MAKRRRSSRRNNKKKTNASTSTWSPTSETSPFKGFDENATPPVAAPIQKLFENESQDKDLLFDKLVDPNYKSNFPQKPMRTYSNKKKQQTEMRLLEFQDCKNREGIIQWLSDSRNVFDRLTQTQRECVSEDDETSVTLDMPSVSQVNYTNNSIMNRSNNQRRRKSRRIAENKLIRARSLDIQIKKNLSNGRTQRHSLAGDTPSLENYHIEEVDTDEETPVPAEKMIVDLMEDEYLDNIEKEMMQERNQVDTGWDRIKDINKSIKSTKRKPKQLNITLESPQFKKGDNNMSNNRTYNLEELENYFIENMNKIMNDANKEMCSSSSTQTEDSREKIFVQSVVDAGNTFLSLIKTIVKKHPKDQTQIQPVISEIQSILTSLTRPKLCEASVQTFTLETREEKLQTDTIDTLSVHVQTEDSFCCQNCTNNNIRIDNKLPDLILNDASIQCSQLKKSDAFVQTEIVQQTCRKNVEVQTEAVPCDMKISVEIQTESLENVFRNREELPKTRSTENPDTFLMEQLITPAQDCNLNQASDVVCLNNEDPFKDFETLDICFDTEELIKRDASKQGIEMKEDESRLSPVEARNEAGTSKGVKRSLSQSPMVDSDEFRNKRACNKFIKEDLSVDFESCAETEHANLQNKKNGHFSEDSDGSSVYEDYLVQVLKNIETDSEPKVENFPKRTRTQEDMEHLEDVIRNATKPVRPTNQTQQPKSWSSSDSDIIFIEAERNMCQIEKDLDYFKTDNTPKTSRKVLFESEAIHKKDTSKFSETVFFSDNEETVVESKAEKTITRANVDEVVKEISQKISSDEVDEEVQKIFAPETHKINILQNIVVKPRDEDFEYLTPAAVSQDPDIIEATPQKSYHCRSEQRLDSRLDITLPPPVEFQDTEEPKPTNNEAKDVEAPATTVTTPRRPLAAINKITSTPISQKNNSELLSLSPISLEKRILGPIELVQQQKFTPLTIVKKPSPKSQSTPKQKSILNYVTSSQESDQSPTSKKKPCIACTRISRSEMMGLTAMANKKLASFSSSFSPKVTHMIVSVSNKNRMKDYTIKSISAVAAGIWVLNYGWIEECLKKNCIVPEEPYEVLDIGGFPGPKTSRLQRTTNPLFKGYKIHAAPPFVATTKQDVENIVKMLGGKVAKMLDEMMDKENYIRIIIAEAKSTQDCESEKYETWLEVFGVVTVDLEWLSRSVSQYALQPLRPYTLCSEDTIESLGYPSELIANVSVSFFQSTSSLP